MMDAPRPARRQKERGVRRAMLQGRQVAFRYTVVMDITSLVDIKGKLV